MEIFSPARGAASTILTDLRHLDGDTVEFGAGGGRSANVVGAHVGVISAAGYFNVGAAAGAGGSRQLIADALGQAVRVVAGGGAPGLQADWATMWNVPTWADLTTYPAAYTPRRRFTVSGLIQQVAASANSTFAYGLHNGTSTLDGAQAGVDVVYDPVLGANWAVRHRATPGGVLVIDVADSGILAVGGPPAFVEFVFTEDTLAPSLVVKINGITQATLTGAQLPAPANAYPVNNGTMGAWYGGGRNVGATADGDFRVRRLRYLVESQVQ